MGAAVYLNEYARNKQLVAVIEYAAETLSGIPSIIYGLVGMLCFCEVLGLQTSLHRGRADAGDYEPADRHAHDAGEPQDRAAELSRGRVRPRRGQVAHDPHGGAARLRRRRHHRAASSPSGRILGESAALLFTAGFGARALRLLRGACDSSGATLTVALYFYAKEQGEFDVAFAIAAVLMLLTLLYQPRRERLWNDISGGRREPMNPIMTVKDL